MSGSMKIGIASIAAALNAGSSVSVVTGSGGGNSYYGVGGAGGGALRINVGGNFSLAGSATAIDLGSGLFSIRLIRCDNRMT